MLGKSLLALFAVALLLPLTGCPSEPETALQPKTNPNSSRTADEPDPDTDLGLIDN